MGVTANRSQWSSRAATVTVTRPRTTGGAAAGRGGGGGRRLRGARWIIPRRSPPQQISAVTVATQPGGPGPVRRPDVRVAAGSRSRSLPDGHRVTSPGPTLTLTVAHWQSAWSESSRGELRNFGSPPRFTRPRPEGRPPANRLGP